MELFDLFYLIMYNHIMAKKVKFIRFGSVSPIKQEGYNPSMPTYHAPPAKKGFYAFVENNIELFLLSGNMSRYGTKNPKYESIKDRNGKKIYISSKLYNLTYEYNDDLVNEVMNCSITKEWVNKHNIDLTNFSSDLYYNFEDWLKKKIKQISGQSKFSYHDTKNNKYLIIKRVKSNKFEHKGDLWHHLSPFGVKGCTCLEIKGSWFKTSYYDFCLLLEKELGKVNKTWIKDREAMQDQDNCWRTSRDHLEVFIEKVYSK